MKAFYFGCNGQPGHYLHDENMRSCRMTDTPWGNQIDTGLLDKKSAQVQGHGVVAKKDGWTALSFWDRSGDGRSGSNSAFIVDSDKTFDEIIAIAAEKFPRVLARHTFTIVATIPA